jgi:putative hydrolase of HD superfamily
MVGNLIEFFRSANNLKWIQRRGWIAKVNVKQPESVADHCYLTALICMILADLKGLNTSKVVKMALLHDLAESVTGDYMPEEVSSAKKYEEENKAMQAVFDNLPLRLRARYEKLWREYKKRTSKEAMLVREIDKFEMALQAENYAQKGYATEPLGQFFDSAAMNIKDKTILKMLKSLRHGR